MLLALGMRLAKHFKTLSLHSIAKRLLPHLHHHKSLILHQLKLLKPTKKRSKNQLERVFLFIPLKSWKQK
ncbi:hypothetical protein NC651_008998 [Populus alba x Populus x berolinensis]|nr:hypothetical protein NC651_008998 [Populus alba x Populus x berolinensis]